MGFILFLIVVGIAVGVIVYGIIKSLGDETDNEP